MNRKNIIAGGLFLSCLTTYSQQQFPSFNDAKKYATYFSTGFTSQFLMNQAVGARAQAWHLPQMSHSQTAILTGVGAACANLPLMLTLTALVNLGLTTVTDTIKGAAEAHAKKTLQTTLDIEAISEQYAQSPKAKEEALHKALKTRVANYKLQKAGSVAAARGPFLGRALAVGATLISLGGPMLVEKFYEKESPKQPEEPNIFLTTQERILRHLDKSEKEVKNNSPLKNIMSVTPEQLAFFTGQLAAAGIHNAFGIKFVHALKHGTSLRNSLKTAATH